MQPIAIIDIYVTPLRVCIEKKHDLSTYHSPIKLLQTRLAIKSIVDAWYKASRDQKDDTNIIKLVSELSNTFGVIQ